MALKPTTSEEFAQSARSSATLPQNFMGDDNAEDTRRPGTDELRPAHRTDSPLPLGKLARRLALVPQSLATEPASDPVGR